MIEMSYEQLSNQGFLQAVHGLAQQRLPIKGAYNVKKLADAIMRARKEIGQEYMEVVVEKFAQRDADGNKIELEGEIQFKNETPEEKDAFLKTQEEFGKKIKKIDRHKLVLGLHLSDNVELSASELSILSPLIEDTESSIPVIPFQGQSTPPNETA